MRPAMASRALLALFVSFGVVSANPDCGTTCHVRAFCEGTAASSYCVCQPGTIDLSPNGTDCTNNGYAVRFVGNFELPAGVSAPQEVVTVPASVAKAHFCPSDAEGYFVRSVRHGVHANPRNMTLPSVTEVSCLYAAQPASVSPDYAPLLSALGPVRVPPAIYRWVLPTTSEPLRIPPTGMTVDSVFFNPSCSESGCWTITGIVTTGEAFNDYSAFNTFFLPQADISGIHPEGALSYDYDYEEVEWTFEPSKHPCTSVNYLADVDGLERISTCCIDYPGTEKGGFIPNYRPTEHFVQWANNLRCDEKFTHSDGGERCWKLYRDWTHWPTASRRCNAAGGYLVTIEDSDTNDRLRTFLDDRGIENAWIGYRMEDNNTLQNWYWDDLRTPTGFENWGAVGPMPAECSWEYLGYEYTDPGEYDELTSYWRAVCAELKFAFMVADGTWGVENQYGGDWPFHMPFVCQFDPPSDCISHVIQRPDYSAPEPEADTCWEVSSVWKTWPDAQADCASRGGNLATVVDTEDYFFLRRVLDHAVVDQVWIGLSDTASEGDWIWADGTELEHTAWYEFDFYYYYASYFWYYDYGSYSWVLNGAEFSDDVLPGDDESQDCAVFYAQDAVWKQEACSPIVYQYVCNVPVENATRCHSLEVEALDDPWDIPFPLQYQRFMVGKFKDMDVSPGITTFDNVDPFFGQYTFEIELDEVELRTKAGKLRGTVGVEHTVDTYLGLANFRPTGGQVLDTFASQTAIHLEKTSFFSVSTHGVQQFTFLEYVNLRLVQVLIEDANFAGTDEEGTRTVRTDTADNAVYVQVTFTMGAQYQPNMEDGGLIPTDSVRVGLGTFFSRVEAAGGMEQVCSSYAAAEATPDASMVGLSAYLGSREDFDARVAQDCAPQAAMCNSPSAVPDAFVSFNIPLGFEVLDDKASSTLSQQVFVDLVVSAVDTVARDADTDPNDGEEPWQMKTTLTASIPIVEGGVNIFCDGFTAKTDLKDVADVDIVVGSASDSLELTRLRILQDVASSDLSSVAPSEIDTDSIESALMTFVLKGNHSYFGGVGRNTLDFTMELDDLITIHLMEDGQAATTTVEAALLVLLQTEGEDNSDSNGLDTDGYNLNGAFRFTIDRSAVGRTPLAALEPTAELLQICSFNPPRPVADNAPLESCIIRRDVRGRGYPARTGGAATAMEILAAADPTASTKAGTDALAAALGTDSAESEFLATILGDSQYAAALAPDFARAIHERYQLNGRYRRAYWVNPGYEWTPTQTAGRSIFSVSQKIYLFALITLDENWTRRRMLLQTSTDPLQDGGSGLTGQALSFSRVSPRSVMAAAFEVPESKVGLFDVALQLTAAEACLSPVEQQAAIRSSLHALLAETASAFHSVQVTRMQVDLGAETCSTRRSIRRLLAAYSSASAQVQMLVVFAEEQAATLNLEKFEESDLVTAVVPDPSNSRDIEFQEVESPWGDGGTTFPEEEEEEGGSDMTLIIAGVCGSVGAMVVLAIGGVLMMRRRQQSADVVQAEATFDVEDLKGELSHDLRSNLSAEDLIGSRSL